MKSVLKGILSLITVGCILAILGAGALIGSYWISYHEGDQVYREIEYLALGTIPDGTENDITGSDPIVDFNALSKANPDLVGWIYIPDTRINYPIVKRENDNEYYLNHLFDGTPNKAGCIFLDTRCNLGDSHCLIHGHNMGNGTMFRDLTLFKNKQFLQEHPYALVLTPDQNYVIEFFAGSVVRIDSPVWQLQFSGSSDRQQWLSDCWNAASVSRNMQISPDDHIITLSTCSYEFKQARWILQGVACPMDEADPLILRDLYSYFYQQDFS